MCGLTDTGEGQRLSLVGHSAMDLTTPLLQPAKPLVTSGEDRWQMAVHALESNRSALDLPTSHLTPALGNRLARLPLDLEAQRPHPPDGAQAVDRQLDRGVGHGPSLVDSAPWHAYVGSAPSPRDLGKWCATLHSTA